jgi:hypothetical protein
MKNRRGRSKPHSLHQLVCYCNRHYYIRTHSGNMLILSCVFMTTVAVCLLIALSFAGLFFIQTRLQASAEEIALSGAQKLNENDRVGQMNNMLARSRQLVFSSRLQLDKVPGAPAYLETHQMAEELLDESKTSALSLASERDQLVSVATKEADSAMTAKLNEIKSSYRMVLPWLRVGSPTLKTPARMGRIADVESNVTALTTIPELATMDATTNIRKYDAVNKYKELLLYFGNKNLPLGGQDANLEYKLSSLAAPIEGTVCPARATLAKSFQTIPTGFIPSATKVELQLEVSSGLGATTTKALTATAAAAATGGMVFE